jgi:hypothetical protein
MTAPSFSLELTWIDGASTMPLQFCPGKGGEEIRAGAAFVDQKDQTASYLTQVPTKLAVRAERSLPVPRDEIELALSATAKGVEVSFWILEFAGDKQIAKTSWPVQRDKVVRWKPHAECESIRLAWRLRGSGALERARVVAQQRGVEEARTARLLATWRALNESKTSLVTADDTADCPAQLGTAPTAVAPANLAAHPFFRAHGITSVELDGDPIVVPEYQQVWPFLQRAIAERRYTWTSPFTGEPMHSADAMIVSEPAGRPYVFVRFESAGHVMYLILSAFRSSRVGVYFPVEEIVVSRLNLGTLICALRSLMVRNAGEVVRYLRTAERRLVVPLNTMSHWGHVMLNELDALQWLFDSGNAANIDRWLLGEIGFFEVDQLFAEIPRDRLRPAMSTEARFRICLEENAMVIRPQIAAYFLGEKAGERLVDYWRREPAGDIEARLAGRFPVLWCEVRANDRLWTNQREGLVAIVDKLRARYPALTIVFAGWSRMLGEVRTDDEKMIAVEHQVLRSLADVLGVDCVPVLGVPTGEKLRWALACDFHVSIVGSGMLFPLLARLPGVTVSSIYYQENDLFLGDRERQSNWMYGIDQLVVVPKQFVTDDAAISNAEIRNFSVDPHALAELVDEELRKL